MMDLIDNIRTFFTRLFCQHKGLYKRAKVVPREEYNREYHYYICPKCGKEMKYLVKIRSDEK